MICARFQVERRITSFSGIPMEGSLDMVVGMSIMAAFMLSTCRSEEMESG